MANYRTGDIVRIGDRVLNRRDNTEGTIDKIGARQITVQSDDGLLEVLPVDVLELVEA